MIDFACFLWILLRPFTFIVLSFSTKNLFFATINILKIWSCNHIFVKINGNNLTRLYLCVKAFLELNKFLLLPKLILNNMLLTIQNCYNVFKISEYIQKNVHVNPVVTFSVMTSSTLCRATNSSLIIQPDFVWPYSASLHHTYALHSTNINTTQWLSVSQAWCRVVVGNSVFSPRHFIPT